MTLSIKTPRAFGSWDSWYDPALLTGKGSPDCIRSDADSVYWLENRPQEQGRCVVVCCTLGNCSRHCPVAARAFTTGIPAVEGAVKDYLPAPFSARSTVHEYGGGAYAVMAGTLYFVNASDQQIYQYRPQASIKPITNSPGERFADLVVNGDQSIIYAISELHQEAVVLNRLVGIDIASGDITVLASGADFYAFPRLSPDEHALCWIEWNHPHMPWDQTSLWCASLDKNTLIEKRLVAGRAQEAIYQPAWSPNNELFYVSDRTQWWNLYRATADEHPLQAIDAEFGLPLWSLGTSTYGFLNADCLGCTYTNSGVGYLAILDLSLKRLRVLDTPYTSFHSIHCANGLLYAIAASPTQLPTLIEIHPKTLRLCELHQTQGQNPPPEWIAPPHAIRFATGTDEQAHGFYYHPTHPVYQGLNRELPPLIVILHGGPTSATTSNLSLKVQFWTSRGFSVLDLNYRGSSGYGRSYRQALYGRWGIAEVDDCIAGAQYLVDQGLVDPQRLIIRGGSAGGYTTLCALTFHTLFSAGASYYGISDLEGLVKDTHKFEAHYMDQLVGPWPESAQEYRRRSPLHHSDSLTVPVIFFQGLQDQVVPPNQTEPLVTALRHKKVPVCYVTYPHEAHGFRSQQAIEHSLNSELYFYQRIFNIPTSGVAPIIIENMPAPAIPHS